MLLDVLHQHAWMASSCAFFVCQRYDQWELADAEKEAESAGKASHQTVFVCFFSVTVSLWRLGPAAMSFFVNSMTQWGAPTPMH